MGIRDVLFRNKASGAFSVNDMRHPTGATSWWDNLLPRTTFNYQREVKRGGRDNSIVMASVLWLAKNFPEAPIQINEQDSTGAWNPLPQHDFYDVLRRPNPYYSGILLWMATIIDFVTDGNAYWIKVYNGGGNLAELWWAPNRVIEPRWPKDGSEYISHYEYAPDGDWEDPIPLETSEVVHFRYGLSDENIRKGTSPLRSVLREIFTDDEAANFTAALLRNLGIPGVMLVPKEGTRILPSQAEEAKKSFIQKFTGDKRGEPIIANTGVDVHKISWSPSDMNLKDLRRIPEERVTAVTGVPAVVAQVGAGLDHMIYNNMEEAKASAFENGIIPIQRLFAAELDVQILDDYYPDNSKYQFAFDNSHISVLQEDITLLEERMGKGMQRGGITRAEYRSSLRLEVSDADQVYFVPAAYEVIPADTLPQDLAGITSTSVSLNSLVTEGWDAKSASGLRRLPRTLVHEANLLSIAFADDLQGAFLAIGDFVERRLLDFANVRIEKSADGYRYKVDPVVGPTPENWPERWDELINHPEALDGVVPNDQLDQYASEVYSHHYAEIAKATAATVTNAAGIDVSVGTMLDDPAMQRVIREGGTRLGLVDLNGQTRKAIIDGLVQARSEGKGPIVAAREIRELVEGKNLYPGIWDRRYKRAIEAGDSEKMAREKATDAANRYRSETIARTETKHAQNKSSLATYRITGFEYVRVHDGDGCGWLDHLDPDKADGKIVTIDEAEAHTLAHPRCVRSFAPTRKKPEDA